MAVGIEAALDHAAEATSTWKNSGTVLSVRARQQLEARIGALIGIALGLALLDQRNQRVEPVVGLSAPRCRAASARR